ncbi:MAG: PAS domain S-box protein [Sedimentisphaerales bacterium]|jgi:PAS domain S-box-containing protein|nr:PAS domain S-box protein [Sedimentisphaerales bacterium]NLT77522.1 PAS domain S-box protein [Planctomycetota bacterium]
MPGGDGSHLLYLPVVLACVWFGWRGFAVAVVAGACLATAHLAAVTSGPAIGDGLFRSLILVAVGGIVAALRERHRHAVRDADRLRAKMDKHTQAAESSVASSCAAPSGMPDADTESMLDALGEHVIRYDTEMRILWANQSACDSAGLSRQAIIGRHCYQIWGHRQDFCPDCPVVAAMKTGRPRQTEKISVTHRTWSLRGYPLIDDLGTVVGGGKVALDVTDIARAECRLIEERNLLSTLIDNLPDAIYVKDRQSRFVLCNPEVLRRKGVATVEEIVGKTDRDFYPLEAAERTYRDEQQLMATDRPIINHERCVIDPASGESTWSLTTKVPLRNENGQIVGLVGIGRDITDRRRAEEAYRTLVDHSLQGLVVIQDERVVFTNQAMSEISGYSVEEILTKSPGEIWDFVRSEDRRRIWDNHRARLEGKSLPENYEFQVVRKDGAVRWLELHACRIEYDGRPAVHATCTDVTARVQTQNALKQSEARIHALLDAIPDLIFRLSADGVFLDYRVAKSQIFYLPPSQFLGRRVAEVLPASIAAMVTDSIDQALTTGQTQTLEYQLPLTEGLCDFECRLVACGEREVIAIVRDISERKQAEHLSKITHDLAVKLNTVDHIRKGARLCLDAAIAASQADCGGIYLVDEASDEMKLLTHHGMSGHLSVSVLAMGKGSVQMRVLAQGKPVYYGASERRMPLSPTQRKAGLRAYAVLPIRDDHTLMGAVVVASGRCDAVPDRCRPALETIAAEMGTTLARLRAEEALLASERNYREIFDAANEAILVHDPVTAEILDVNQTGLDMFGYSHEQLQRMGVAGLWAEPRADSEEVIRGWFTRVAREGPQVFECLCKSRDGRCFWVEVNLKQARIGGHDRVVAVGRDVTERIEAARAAENHRVELARAWHANTLGEMASGLAHELNQPLCAIVNYAGSCRRLAGREPVDMRTLCEGIEHIADQAERAAAIIRRIRGLVAKRRPDQASLDVRDVLDETMRMVDAEIARLGITVVRDLAEDLPRVRGDAVGIQQVTLNLVRNALDAMNGATSVRSLTLATRPADGGDGIEIAVADTGRGLPSQLTERVFDSFFTTKNEGLGIGLSLSRRIVEAHGGRLWAEANEDSGAVFRFTLPAEGVEHEQCKPHRVCRR